MIDLDESGARERIRALAERLAAAAMLEINGMAKSARLSIGQRDRRRREELSRSKIQWRART